MKTKNKYRGETRRWGRIPGFPLTHSCANRDELIKYYAGLPVRVAKIYSTEAHGYLKRGETLDGFQREIALQTKIIKLEEMLAEAKRQA